MIESDQFIIILIGTVFLLSLPLLVFLSKTVQNITPYLYMNARLKAKEGKLITKGQFEDMVSAHSLSEISSLLEGTAYGNEMQGVMINDAEAVEEVLKKHRDALYGEIMGMMPAKIKDVFSYLDREGEASTIKGIFRDIHGQLFAEPETQAIVPTGEFHEETLKRMYESRSVAELLPLLEGTRYESLMEKLPVYEQTKKLNVFESAVDNLVLTETWKVISSRNDLSQIHTYFATKMDLMNLKVLLRAKRDRLSWDEIENFLLPLGSLYQHAKTSFGEEEDVRGLINSLEGTSFYTPLMEVFPEYEKTSSLVPLEKAVDEFLLRMGWDIAVKHPFGVGPLMGFLSLKEAEMRNVKTIAVAKEAQLDQDEIRSLMVSV
jgi:V/A-type H+-transporting ATPase subunit C